MIRFVIGFFRYLFPKRRLKQHLPLLPLAYSSSGGTRVDPARSLDIAMLKGHGVARTDHDAMRLLDKFPDKKAHEIISNTKRLRRRRQRIVRAIGRLKRLW